MYNQKKRLEMLRECKELLERATGLELEVTGNAIRVRGFTIPFIFITIENKISYSYPGNFEVFGIDDYYRDGQFTLEQFKKQFKKWSLEAWKKEFAEKFDFYYDDRQRVMFKGCVVVASAGDVNFTPWHDKKLKGHPLFKFDGDDIVEVTVQNCKEFEAVVEEFLNHKWSWEV